MSAPAPCRFCGGPILFTARWSAKYCSAQCKYKARVKRERAAHPVRYSNTRNAARAKRRWTCGVRCKWCQALPSDGVAFVVPDRCEPCTRAVARRKCPKCEGPARSNGGSWWHKCCCDQKCPRGYVPVILVNDVDNREREVWRGPPKGDVLTFDGCPYEFTLHAPDDPIVITLPTTVWARIRV